MPYVSATTKAGKTILCEKYYSSRFNKKGIERTENKNITPEYQEKVNTRREIKKLTLLMNANFGDKDYHLVLNYQKEHRPSTPRGSQARPHVIFTKDKKRVLKAWHTTQIHHSNRIRKKRSTPPPSSDNGIGPKDI